MYSGPWGRTYVYAMPADRARGKTLVTAGFRIGTMPTTLSTPPGTTTGNHRETRETHRARHVFTAYLNGETPMSSQQQQALWRWAAIAISGIAAAWTLFHLIWNMSTHTTDDYWGQALLVLFVLAVLLTFVRFFQERTAVPATVSPNEPFPEPAISKFFFGSSGSAALWFVVRMNVGATWFLAAYEKIKAPAVWGTSGVALKGFVEGALAEYWSQPRRSRLVRQFSQGFRAPPCRSLLLPGHLRRDGRGTGLTPGGAHRYRRWIRCLDESELPAGRYRQHQSHHRNVRAVPLLLLESLWLDRS